jgi:hypothetical protein
MDKKLSTKIAAAGVGIVALAGISIASPALAVTDSSTGSTTSTTAPTFGKGHGKGGHGMKGGVAATPQTVTVNVPADGASYILVVTEPAVAATATTPAKEAHSHSVSISGTGAQTVTLPRLHTGKFTLQLVKLNGTVVNGEVGTDGKLIAPITVG